ncbi:hypothetical protein [Phocaeicola sartorii]|jgi:opacity protein-like surface antigen|uniref:Uncharacterized protein n=1 Tax=Phocaeicola sartorii TaxID=671267 RepID=R9ICJ3_9BACT|nr:hypothetical protein [Phocaeicola sartorii]EOS15137.1 hypothetical protein C802_00470 [Phocaeicola sartorii]MCR1847027.1 hypothetical protein [Phocaeicola sartorii]NBH65522.1 hypothetical protein [Phocaeicola sartorii]NUK97589.1 hypothetical protein [Phocaeicola sartorii]
MKKLILIVFTLLYTSLIFAQKGNSQFAILGGYENFPNLIKESGYNIGTEFKYYTHKRIFIIANFHAGINNGKKLLRYMKNDRLYNHNLKNTAKDYMIGFGLGGDLIQKEKHKAYIQSTIGLGNSEEKKTHLANIDSDTTEMTKKTSTSYAISATIGYDYQLNEWLTVGMHYTGYQIGYQYKNSCNVKISILFNSLIL